MAAKIHQTELTNNINNRFYKGLYSHNLKVHANGLGGVSFKWLTPKNSTWENEKKKNGKMRTSHQRSKSKCWLSKTLRVTTVTVILKVYLQDVRFLLSAHANVQPNWLYITAMKRDFSSHLMSLRDPAQPMSRGLVKEEAMRHPAIQTTLPMTGHSLATQSALNRSKDTTQMPQGHLTYSASQAINTVNKKSIK